MSSSISKALEHLGFKSDAFHEGEPDFRLEDHLDGNGIRIVWLSKKQPPTPEAIEAARAVAPTTLQRRRQS